MTAAWIRSDVGKSSSDASWRTPKRHGSAAVVAPVVVVSSRNFTPR